jgi:lipopolysaccharide export system protein LptA
MEAGQLTLYLRDDNSIARMTATGEVRGTLRGAQPARVEAAQGDFVLGPKNELQSGVLFGGVKFQQEGTSPFHGAAGRATLTFGPGNVLTQVKATEGVSFIRDQRASARQAAQSLELASDALDLFLAQGRLERAQTGGAAKITIRQRTSAAAQGDTVITAGRFDMSFGADSRLRALHGEPDARIVGSTPGQPDKVSTSQTLDVAFNPSDGGIASVVQQGHVQYQDAQRSATADQARYTPGDENLVLTGSPRWTEAGGSTTAHAIKLNQRTGEALAEGEVKTTYRETRPQPGGALLGGSEPIHVTAESMTARRQTGTAIYSGSARLWQGANIVEAPLIEFDRASRVLKAKGAKQQPVFMVFLQNGSKFKGTPVTVTSSSLTYSDPEHRAVFQGAVLIKSTAGRMSADDASVLLKPRTQGSGPQSTSDASQIEEIVARGHVVVEQPSRKAAGNTMAYTASDGKYVLSGGRPSIFDAERGVITGDSLTFYSRGDTVLVGSESATRTVTQTHTGK